MWRRIRPFCSRSIARFSSARRASGGTANTPRRSSATTGVVFIFGSSQWGALRRAQGGHREEERLGSCPRRVNASLTTAPGRNSVFETRGAGTQAVRIRAHAADRGRGQVSTARHSHRRYNPLLDEWVLCSPGRLDRPWQGQTETASDEELPSYDPDCALCPGNRRAKGEANPHYPGTFAFDNDYPALHAAPETTTPSAPRE